MRQERGRGALFGGAMAKKDKTDTTESLPTASASPFKHEDNPLKGTLSIFGIALNAPC